MLGLRKSKESFVYSEMDGSWSREQIASGLRLAGSGVPVIEVVRMMGVSPEIFAAWRAEYAELFDKLVSRCSEPEQLSPVTKSVGGRRIAHMSDCVGGEDVESELRACKIRYSTIENAATIAGELLRSGSLLGNFQKPTIYRKDFPPTFQPPLEGPFAHALPTAGSEFSDSSCGRSRETDDSLMGQAGENLLILVSAQVGNQKSDLVQSEVSRGEVALSGVISDEIDELRWRTYLADGGQIDEPIIRDAVVKFSLDAILERSIDAIRAFYTSPIDALLLGKFLIQKSARTF
jgi:transposase